MSQGKRIPDKETVKIFRNNIETFIGKGKKWETNISCAGDIGVSSAQVANYLKGSLPQADTLLKISQKTGKSMDWLLTGEEKIDTIRAGPPGETKYLDMAAKILSCSDPRIKKDFIRDIYSYIGELTERTQTLEPVKKSEDADESQVERGQAV